MKAPILSVIMPVFNGGKYLSLSIESILKQTFNDFELLIIEDGSSDVSVDTIQAYAAKDSRIKIFSNGETKGIAYSLNKGLKMAIGKYIAQMDADAISLPGRFENQLSFLELHPEVGVVGTSYQVIDQQGTLLNTVHPPRTDVLIRWELLFQNPLAFPTVMYRADIGKTCTYNETCVDCEDYEFWTRFLGRSKGVNLEECLVLSRQTPEGVSTAQDSGATGVSQKVISVLMGEGFVDLEETVTLREWYRSKSVPLFTPAEFALFDKWMKIYSVFSQDHNLSSDSLMLIQEKFSSVNTLLSTRDQIEQNTLWLSVVVCSYNRAKELLLLLDSLTTQTLAPEMYEVIIVDNNSTDETSEIAKAFCAENPNARYVNEVEQGVAYARNRGLQEAQGVYVAYVDDDAIVHTRWLEIAAEIVSAKGYGAFGGPYFPYYKQGKPKWFKDEYGSSTWLPTEACILHGKYLVGGNMFFRKDILCDVDGFPVDYGMRGEKIGYGEETYTQIKILRENEGVHIYFSPDLYIKHLVSENKMRVTWPLKRYFAQGMDNHRHEIGALEGRSTDRVRFRSIQNLGKIFIKMMHDFFIKIHFRDRDTFPFWQNYVYEKGRSYGYEFSKEWANFSLED